MTEAKLETMNFEENYVALVKAACKMRAILDVSRAAASEPDHIKGCDPFETLYESFNVLIDYLDEISEHACHLEEHYKADTTAGDVP